MKTEVFVRSISIILLPTKNLSSLVSFATSLLICQAMYVAVRQQKAADIRQIFLHGKRGSKIGNAKIKNSMNKNESKIRGIIGS